MKSCTKCKTIKVCSEYYNSKTARDGLQSWCKACTVRNNQGYSVKIRADAIFKLGGVCKCGFSDIRALQIDHVNGGGSQEYRSRGQNRAVYRRIASGETLGYQVLCANCNWIKRSEQNENGNYFLSS